MIESLGEKQPFDELVGTNETVWRYVTVHVTWLAIYD